MVGTCSQDLSHIYIKMSIHVSEKDINDKILSQNPVPRNIKSSQKLDDYRKDLLLESQGNGIPNQEKI